MSPGYNTAAAYLSPSILETGPPQNSSAHAKATTITHIITTIALFGVPLVGWTDPVYDPAAGVCALLPHTSTHFHVAAHFLTELLHDEKETLSLSFSAAADPLPAGDAKTISCIMSHDQRCMSHDQGYGSHDQVFGAAVCLTLTHISVGAVTVRPSLCLITPPEVLWEESIH